jgi:histidinol dehydrogenase
MEIIRYPKRKNWSKILKRPVFDIHKIEKLIIPIISAIRKEGDIALKRFTKKYDKVSLPSILADNAEFKEAESKVDENLKPAIMLAIKNIRIFHQSQI